MTVSLLQRAAVVLCALMLTACAHRSSGSASRTEPIYNAGGPGSAEVTYGVVQAVERVAGKGEASGTGAVVGAIAGALVGRQFGFSKDGRDQGTVVGTFVGALIGNEVERQSARGGAEVWRVTVNLDQGGQRRVDVPAGGAELRPGDRVRVEGGRVVRI
ncbi:MAG: glycine zipper 2TM domain-containing protein [Aquabacterium sp.]